MPFITHGIHAFDDFSDKSMTTLNLIHVFGVKICWSGIGAQLEQPLGLPLWGTHTSHRALRTREPRGATGLARAALVAGVFCVAWALACCSLQRAQRWQHSSLAWWWGHGESSSVAHLCW